MTKRSFILFAIGSILLFGFLWIKFHPTLDRPTEPKAWLSHPFKNLKQSQLWEVMDSSIICLKNQSETLPLNDLMKSTTYLTLGGNSDAFVQGIQRFDDDKFIQIYSEEEADKIANCASDRWVVSVHPCHPDSLNLPSWANKILQSLPPAKEKILVVFGDPTSISFKTIDNFSAVVLAPENHPQMQDRVGQKLMGAMALDGHLKMKFLGFKEGQGINVSQNGRLRFAHPDELGFDENAFNRIDPIANQGIKDGAYPGCQIVVVVKGAILYRKSFGHFTYDSDAKKVEDEDVYDIASITKIAASTLTAMHLVYQKKLNVDDHLDDYIPDLTGKTAHGEIVIREMMAHQAGLEPFIPFYKRTLTDDKPISPWYSQTRDDEHGLEVADELFLKTDYKDSMYARILRNPLKEKKYVYSDLCYYFMQSLFDKITGETQDTYVRNHFYNKMGLRYINYKPLKHYKKEHIVPTENDQYFRKQLLWGHVHDPGAAMLGGVGGHAGVFANATDLASVMQLFLNQGEYAGQRFFDKSIVDRFTSAQYPGNKRGIGFDRPSATGGGTCDELASQQSFGHSGFTGTLAWADPKNDVVFVFLSNRVHPSQDNWKLRDMGIRTKIQHVVYEIVNARYGN